MQAIKILGIQKDSFSNPDLIESILNLDENASEGVLRTIGGAN
jgi:hypothetical protein